MSQYENEMITVTSPAYDVCDTCLYKGYMKDISAYNDFIDQ